jgi:hypothetical protein
MGEPRNTYRREEKYNGGRKLKEINYLEELGADRIGGWEMD